MPLSAPTVTARQLVHRRLVEEEDYQHLWEEEEDLRRLEGDEEASSSRSSSSGSAQPQILVRTRKASAFRRRKLVPWLCAAAWVAVGVAAFAGCGFEQDRMDVVTAVYLIAQITTAVGYGDITPVSDGMRLFMTAYVFVGNIIAALVITERLEYIVHRSRSILKAVLVNKVVECAEAARGGEAPAQRRCGGSEKFKDLGVAFSGYFGSVLAGCFFFGVVFRCSCPMGEDCEAEPFKSCSEGSSGHTRSLGEALYMSIITLTSVGFGDDHPKTQVTRLFATVWMLWGVANVANFLAELAHSIMVWKMELTVADGMSHELFQKIDSDQNGALSKFEFVTYMLVKHGLVSEADLDVLLGEFDKFDRDGNGEMSYAEISPDLWSRPG